MPVNAPMDPGGTTQVPAQEITSDLSQLQYEHAEYRHIHDNHNNMDAELKTMILEGVESTYIFALHNVFTGYMEPLTKLIMNKLITRYGQITASNTKDKKNLK